MNAKLNSIVGAAVATVALALVACGKSGGSNNSNNNGINCIQVGATCVATPPGYISSGTWRGRLYNSATGPVEVSIRLNPNGGGGYGGGGWGGGYPGMPGYGVGVQPAVQTIVTVTIRTSTTVIQGSGIATGGPSNFGALIQAQTQYGVQQLSIGGSFVDGTQQGMNLTISGSINVGGLLTGTPNNQNLGGGYGYGGSYGGGYGIGGGYGYVDPNQGFDPWY